MRKELQKLDEQRESFTGIFKRYGLKSGFRGPSTETILLASIRNAENRLVADHCWFNLTKGFEKLGGLKDGDLIRFEARVKKYTKGYVHKRAGIDQSREDYKLSHPSQIAFATAGKPVSGHPKNSRPGTPKPTPGS